MFTLNRRGCSNPEQERGKVRGAFISSVRYTWKHHRDLAYLSMFVAYTVKAGKGGSGIVFHLKVNGMCTVVYQKVHQSNRTH